MTRHPLSLPKTLLGVALATAPLASAAAPPTGPTPHRPLLSTWEEATEADDAIDTPHTTGVSDTDEEDEGDEPIMADNLSFSMQGNRLVWRWVPRAEERGVVALDFYAERRCSQRLAHKTRERKPPVTLATLVVGPDRTRPQTGSVALPEQPIVDDIGVIGAVVVRDVDAPRPNGEAAPRLACLTLTPTPR